ncbi:hypothetical protein [Aeoliella sp. SH292]|uniref:hypothetical protein n=1 Tax=Aeoliella sp. SH292 TaxID=3454464 RepID=UPI003F9B882C
MILCWEKGRQRAAENPSLAARAVAGELVETCWCRNSFHYLAYWQGLRGENLSIVALEGSFQTITCSVTGRSFAVGPYSKERDRAQAKFDRQLLASKKAQ